MPTDKLPTESLDIGWRRPVTDAELVELTASHGGNAESGWWDRIRDHSLGWVTARSESGHLLGFVNVAWDGGDHAFLIDTKTRPSHQRDGLGTAVVRRAVEEARAAGCEWLFVDFEPHLEQFYLGSCGFRPTAAGLIHLTDE
jgi:GNAT superfamily N-acetyltransferase